KGINLFACLHSERGKYFHFVAAIGNGNGKFFYPLETEAGRSYYARVRISGNQPVFISGELTQENVIMNTRAISERSVELMSARNEELINKKLQLGSIIFKDNPKLQKVYDLNKKIILSMQDMSGALHVSPEDRYYLLNNQDQCITSTCLAYTGWIEPLEASLKFILNNPNTTSNKKFQGNFFGELTGGSLTNWQEDVLHYVIWAAFTHWTQTGNRTFISGYYLGVMTEALNWLERYCFNETTGLFGRYYYRDFPADNPAHGWNFSNGKPIFQEKLITYKNDTISRSYDIYINFLYYSSYMMLSAMTDGLESEVYLKKALELEKNLHDFAKETPIPYGICESTSGKKIKLGAYGLDSALYVNAFTLPHFLPIEINQLIETKNKFIKHINHQSLDLSNHLLLLQSIDGVIHEDEIMQNIDTIITEIIQPGANLNMPYAIMKKYNNPDSVSYQNTRAHSMSIGSFMATATGLGLKRLPYGIAVKNTKYLSRLNNYQYQKSYIDFIFNGTGNIFEILINGEKLSSSYQIPEKKLIPGKNLIFIKMGNEQKQDNPLLISSTVKLLNIKTGNKHLNFEIQAFGKNTLVFSRLDSRNVVLKNPADQVIDFSIEKIKDLSFIQFPGKGIFEVIISQ
ncbi:MAG: hypothetical protein ACOCUL_01915, partial [Bacteroidota bacterium]